MNPIIAAINNHQYLEFYYEGYLRRVIPFAYGNHKSTHKQVMRALQVAGSSNSGKFDIAKLFTVAEMSGIRVVGETFEVPERYAKGDEHISPILAEL